MVINFKNKRKINVKFHAITIEIRLKISVLFLEKYLNTFNH